MAGDAFAPFRLDGRIALVVGGGGAIGGEAARTLAAAGATVLVADLDAAAAGGVADELSGAEPLPLDITDEGAVAEAMTDIAERHGSLDILVNSAGAVRRLPAVETTLEVWNLVVSVNLTGLFLCCREAAKQMLMQGSGSIINVASMMGHVGNDLYPNPAYHATKGAVINLTRALAVEWGRQGVRVNALSPTFVETPFTTGLLGDPEMRGRIEAATPMGRVAQTGDLSGAILYLASDASALVTGQSLVVDGGWTAK